MNFQKCVSNFTSTRMAIHGAYSYGAQNRDFVAGSLTGLTRGLVSSVAKVTPAFEITFYIVEEQRLEKIRRSSNPTKQKVLPQFLIARYPQSTYSTIRPQLFHTWTTLSTG